MALELTERLRQIAAAIDEAPDIESARRRVQGPLREAFVIVGALE
jgi:hypothetical protein